MPDDERDDRSGPGEEGFIASLLREATITGTGDDPAPPPEEPQAAGLPGARPDGDTADDDTADDEAAEPR
jgi:hypothetical protein